MKTTVPWKKPDGTTVIAQCTWVAEHGRLACQLLGALLATEITKAMIAEEDTQVNPRRVAVVACNMAEAMYQEMEERDWLIQLPDPNEDPIQAEDVDKRTKGNG